MPEDQKYPGVYVEEVANGVRSISGVATSITAFLGQSVAGPLYQPLPVHSFSDFERTFGPLVADRELGPAILQFFRNGGSDARVVRIPDNAGDADWQKGIEALEALDLFNLLVLPGVTAQPVLAAAATFCERRRAFLILDTPAAITTPDDVRQHVASGEVPRSRNAALYYPWVAITDPATAGATRWCPPGGTVAGILARSDANRGVWKAPAGAEAAMSGVQDLKYRLTDRECSLLNPLGINCLRSLPGQSSVVWGARTLEGADASASEWKYVPVRRLALFIEESLDRGTQWAVFEPNAEALWAQIRLQAGAFLHNLFRQGAFTGQTAEEAYFMKCDRETTTPQDVANGLCNLLVGFAPLKPAEFVILKLQQRAGPAAS